jgi:hypothetical protein
MTIQELEIFIEKYGKIIRKNMPSGTNILEKQKQMKMVSADFLETFYLQNKS